MNEPSFEAMRLRHRPKCIRINAPQLIIPVSQKRVKLLILLNESVSEVCTLYEFKLSLFTAKFPCSDPFISLSNKALVLAIFWARFSCRLALEDTCLRMRITLGVVLIRSLVCAKCVWGVSGAVPEWP